MLVKGILALLMLVLLGGCVTHEQQVAYGNAERLRIIKSNLQEGKVVVFYPIRVHETYYLYEINANEWKHKDLNKRIANIGDRSALDRAQSDYAYPIEFFTANLSPLDITGRSKWIWVMNILEPGDYFLETAVVKLQPHSHIVPARLASTLPSSAFTLDFINSHYFTNKSHYEWDAGASHQEVQMVGVDAEGNPEMDWVNVVDRQAGYVNNPRTIKNDFVKLAYNFDKNNSIAEFTLKPGAVYIMTVGFKFESPDDKNYRGHFISDSESCKEIPIAVPDKNIVSMDKSKYRCPANSLAYGVDESLNAFFDPIASKLVNEIKVAAPIENIQFKFRGTVKGEIYEKGVKEVFYEKSL